MDAFREILGGSWLVLGQMSPYLLFGFLVAGFLSVCVSPEFVERHLGGRGFGPVWKASLLGVPLPLCSCGVIPVSAAFRRHGASRAATTSFLLSTPQTGVDSIAVTYSLLGGVFAVYRPVVALLTGLLGGLLVMLFDDAKETPEDAESSRPAVCTDACCADRGRHGVVRRALEYGFLTLPRDIGGPLLIGILIAGVIGALASPDQWHAYLGGGVWSILLAMALGIPLYVCASASVPIAVGLLHLGASPGAALAFLIAGPATNAATIATLWKVLGGRNAVLYLLTIALSAVLGGLALNALLPNFHLEMLSSTPHDHEAMVGSWWLNVWAALLLGMLAMSFASKFLRLHRRATSGRDPDEPCVRLDIAGMHCSHCEATVSKALRGCHGVTRVEVSAAQSRAVVAGTDVDLHELLAAVEAAGYQAAVVDNPR
ncbi:MAG: SO_0444 family Cu/Zn efflux transporter [Planctomycetaceae bacterium]|nr:SO_0444 family Cu/Zn efflux transporter [Planctomycetaceae bacterium]